MYKTLHHIKLIGENFWREVVDRQARRGAYEKYDASVYGVTELFPAMDSYVQVDFTVPSSYKGNPEDYTTKAYLVEGSLGGLIGILEPTIMFAEGETEKILSLEGGSIPVGAHLLKIVVNRRGDNGSKMNYKFSFGSKREGTAYPDAYSAMLTAPSGEYSEYDTLTYNYRYTPEQYRTLKSITITRTAQSGSTPYPALTIDSPGIIFDNEKFEDEMDWQIPNGSYVREIVWNGADTQKRLKARESERHWVVVEPDDNGRYPRIDVTGVGDLGLTLSTMWYKLKELLAGKVDKVTGKGLSTNDYTTAEKTKLAGVEAGANAYTLPEASNNTLGGVYTTYGPSGGWSYSGIFAETQMVNLGTKRTLRAILPYATSKVGGYGIVQAGEGLQMPFNGTIDMKEMTGATANTNGSIGAPPVPKAGDQMKYLRGDGTWDDIRPALLSPYPVKASALDSMNMLATGAQAGASDAAVGVPPYQLRLKITSASASTAVITVKSYVESIMGGAGTTYTVDLTKANGGQAVNQNTIVDIWDGLRMTIGNTEAYLSEAIMQKDSYIVVTCDVAEVGMYYRQGLTNALTALENRIAALENA